MEGCCEALSGRVLRAGREDFHPLSARARRSRANWSQVSLHGPLETSSFSGLVALGGKSGPQVQALLLCVSVASDAAVFL